MPFNLHSYDSLYYHYLQVMKYEDYKQLGSEAAVKVCVHVCMCVCRCTHISHS